MAAWKLLCNFARRLAKWDGFWWMVMMVGVLIISGYLSWRYLVDLQGTEDSLSTTIRNVGLVVAGVEALLLAAWRSTVAGRQAHTAQQGLLNERYQKGAEMMDSSALSVRLGGIYVLRRLAEDHPEQYHIQVMELLCAFARNPTQNIPESQDAEIPDDPYSNYEPSPTSPKFREDVQAAVTAIGRRSKRGTDREKMTEGFLLDLSGADLRQASMCDMDFSKADLRGAVLRGARLTKAILVGTDLADADLRGACLAQADLTDAVAPRANLRGAKLHGATLTGARLPSACLSYAELPGVTTRCVNLTGATLWMTDLSNADLSAADLTRSTMGGVDLTGAVLQGTNLSCANFAKVPSQNLALGHKYTYAQLTQMQLDEARCDPENPPTIACGTTDIETGNPLTWCCRPPIEPQPVVTRSSEHMGWNLARNADRQSTWRKARTVTGSYFRWFLIGIIAIIALAVIFSGISAQEAAILLAFLGAVSYCLRAFYSNDKYPWERKAAESLSALLPVGAGWFLLVHAGDSTHITALVSLVGLVALASGILVVFTLAVLPWIMVVRDIKRKP